MERASLGSRVTHLFQVMDKVSSHSGPRKLTSGEDVQQLRYATTKLLHLVNSQEKFPKDAVLKHCAHTETLIRVLDCSLDRQILHNVLCILIELIGKSQVGKRCSLLVSAGATHVLLSILSQEAREQCDSDDLLLAIHQILAKIGLKDRKFPIKARLNQALSISLNMIKNNTNNLKLLMPVMQVLKLYSTNGVNCSYLGKQNAIPYLFKVMSVCGRKHINLLKLVLDTMINLTKSKSNSARTVGQGGVHVLISMYYDWHSTDTKQKYIKLRKSILNVLKNVTNLKSGRVALLEAEGIRVLYDSVQNVADSREMEGLILQASLIMRKCFPKNKLPLATIDSPIMYILPSSDFHIPEWFLEQKAYGYHYAAAMSGGRGDSDHSSLDEDDDIDSEEERNQNDHSADESQDTGAAEPPYRRTSEDLDMYTVFLPELNEYEDIIASCTESLVVIPTEASKATDTSSSSGLNSPQYDLQSPMLDLCLSGPPPDLFEDYPHRQTSGSRTGSRQSPRRQCAADFDTAQSTSEFSVKETVSVDAINVKTGSNVFSLGPSTSSNVLSRSNSGIITGSKLTAKSSSRKQNKGMKGVPGKKPSVKDKKKQQQEAWSDVQPSLSITPFPSPIPRAPDKDEFDLYDFLADSPMVETPVHDHNVYRRFANETKSSSVFDKLAYPDLYGSLKVPHQEPFYVRKFGVQRSKIFEDIDRMIHPDQLIERIVYDLDTKLSHNATSQYMKSESSGMDSKLQGDSPFTHNDKPELRNIDDLRVGTADLSLGVLNFNSQFESGNLRKAIQVRQFEYDLILNPDINTNHYHQWFYFEVSNMVADIPYRFNIVNCEKLNSQFNFGMKPVMFSVIEAMGGRAYWKRTGTDICYYRNHFTRSSSATGGVKGKSYYTTTFTIIFPHSRDVCYLAYHYPYTYSTLRSHLFQWQRRCDHKQIYFRNQVLCETISGNAVPVLTITSKPQTMDHEGIEEFRKRPYIFLSGRVHPGESNSSWVMKGTIDFLLSDTACAKLVRDTFIFKIVPMLNPDGVINGSHRCSLVGEDLNRRWLYPCPKLHPTIYHTKGLLQYLALINRVPLVYCDYHGHSRRKNVFMYGCAASQSWLANDTNNPACTGNRTEDNAFKTLPRLLSQSAPAFSLQNCSFLVELVKESTARMVVWRQIRIARSYTMESSYSGCDQGKYKDLHITPRELEEMGRKFCEALPLTYRLSDISSTVPESFDNGPLDIDDTTTQAGLYKEDTQLKGVTVEKADNSAEDDDEDDEEEEESRGAEYPYDSDLNDESDNDDDEDNEADENGPNVY